MNAVVPQSNDPFEVHDTAEFQRVAALPRRDWEAEAKRNDLYLRMSKVFQAPGGQQTLRLIQASSLADAHDARGLFAPIRVGEGKTLLTFLLPTIITNIKRPVLLLPAGLIEKTWLEFKELRKHWVCHPAFLTRAEFNKTVMSYEILGRDSGKDQLNERHPDLIIADECHNLRNRTAARTRRVERYITFNNTTCFCGLSGTITKRSVRDYWHLLYWALKQNMPLPRIQEEMEKWADVLDERKIDGVNRRGPGPLLHFCTPEELALLQPKRTQRLGVTEQMPDEMYRNKTRVVRTAYQRRLRDTYGVISSSEANLDCSLVLRRLNVDPGRRAVELIEHMRREHETPNGEEIAMPTDLWRHARELACGFWYAWWDIKRFNECLQEVMLQKPTLDAEKLHAIRHAWSTFGSTNQRGIEHILRNGVLGTDKDIALVKALETLGFGVNTSSLGTSKRGTASHPSNTKNYSGNMTGPATSVERSDLNVEGLGAVEAASRLITATKQAASAGYSAHLATERSACWVTILRAYPGLLPILQTVAQSALPPDYWKQARKTWNWNVRQILDPQEGIHYARFQHLHIDSPMQVALNIKNGRIDDPLIRNAYERWEQVRNDYKINVVAEWVSDNTLQFCLRWLREHKTGIVWTEHTAFGERLAQMAGTGFCAAGGVDANGRPIEDYKGAPVVSSVKANHAGRNLQAWNRNLIVTAMPTGTLWEQLIGRTHRPGQEADTVYVDWISACSEQDDGFNQLLADARYIQDTTGQSQKVLYADKI